MPNNLEAPSKSAESAESQTLSIKDLPQKDVESFRKKDLSSGNKSDETMTQFEGNGNSKFEITGFEDTKDTENKGNDKADAQEEKQDALPSRQKNVESGKALNGQGDGKPVAPEQSGKNGGDSPSGESDKKPGDDGPALEKPEEKPQLENGASPGDGHSGARPGGEGRPSFEPGANAELNQDGSLNSVQIKDGHVQTTYESSKNGFTRTRESGAGIDVTQFDSDGNPTSFKTFNGPEDTQGREYPVNPNDRLTVKTNENGDQVISSVDKAYETSSEITINKEGNVSHRSKRTFNEQTDTEYNDDGSVNSNSVTQFDRDGQKDRTVITNDQGTTTYNFDDSEKLTRRHFEGQGVEQTTTWDETGNQITDTEHSDGTSLREVLEPDGTKTKAGSTDDTNYFITTKPDGSQTTSIESDEKTSYEVKDKDGNWVKYSRDKNSGISTVSRGDKDGPFEGSQQSRETK